MEVDVIINSQLTTNARLTEELREDNNLDRRTISKNKKYHVFFCYRNVPNDKLWVKEVMEKLENDYGYICCDHERDFLPGTKIMDNIKYGIKNSEKVVSVLSNEGLDSGYLEFETAMALNEGIYKRENILIPVLLDDCKIPEELKVLTYIDARKEINERTWWPKLIAAIESKEGCSFFKGRKEEETKYNSEDQPSFNFQILCSLETTFSCKQCSIQSTSKYIPWELVSNEEMVPVETIKSIKRDLLDAPIIRCKQKSCCFFDGWLFLFLAIWISIFIFDIVMVGECATTKTMSKEDCFRSLGIYVVIEITIGICCGVGCRCYYKVPRRIDKKITEYNTELIKNGILITLVYVRQWRNASKYVLFHLREDRKIEREKFVNISGTEAYHDADDVPLLTQSGNEDLDQATKKYVETFELQSEYDSDDVPPLTLCGNDEPDQTNKTLHWRHDMKLDTETFVDTSEMQEKHTADDVSLLAVSENEQLDQHIEVYQKNVGQRHMDDDQGSTIVNISDEENGPQQFTQNSKFAQSSDLGNLEDVAMTLLLKYAHEYLRLAINGKMKNPKEDRHKADYTCLCQYIEKTDKKFRKLVNRNKTILAKNSGIEHITENKKLDAFRL